MDQHTATPIQRKLRIAALAMCALGTGFWLYTFYYISQVPPGDGTGFQWLAEAPLTAIQVFMVLPAVLLSISNRAVAFAAGLAAVSLVAYGVLWAQLLTEFQS